MAHCILALQVLGAHTIVFYKNMGLLVTLVEQVRAGVQADLVCKRPLTLEKREQTPPMEEVSIDPDTNDDRRNAHVSVPCNANRQ